MLLKNQKLTGDDEDSNIRQKNLDILKMKARTQEADGSYGATKPKSSGLNNFRTPNYQRTLQAYEGDQAPGDTAQTMEPVGRRMHLESGKASLRGSV